MWGCVGVRHRKMHCLVCASCAWRWQQQALLVVTSSEPLIVNSIAVQLFFVQDVQTDEVVWCSAGGMLMSWQQPAQVHAMRACTAAARGVCDGVPSEFVTVL